MMGGWLLVLVDELVVIIRFVVIEEILVGRLSDSGVCLSGLN